MKGWRSICQNLFVKLNCSNLEDLLINETERFSTETMKKQFDTEKCLTNILQTSYQTRRCNTASSFYFARLTRAIMKTKGDGYHVSES